MRAALLRGFGRGLALLVVFGIPVVVSWRVAEAAVSAEDELAAALRGRLVAAHDARPGAAVGLERLGDETWSQMFVFPPLTPGWAIRARIGRRSGADDAAEQAVPADRALVVLTNGERVVGQARVPRGPIDMSCATAARGALTPGDRLLVVRLRGRLAVPALAAVSDPRAQRSCLAGLPPAGGAG